MPGKQQIMRAIREGLDSLELTPTDDWTKAILTRLCEIGRGFGFQVGAKVDESNRDWAEWLYDVTWLQYDDHNLLVDAPLVAECEWGQFGDIKDDFEKLLLARSGVRLMIYDGNHKSGSRGIAEELAKSIREFNGSRAEDAWLLVAWEKCGEKAWRFRYFTVGWMNGPVCFP